ncbi:hypothetical protein HLH89_21380 [Rhizobium laguerreae]|uniref:hypothetical protein n=1 Tax=Rhizobium laguerreae TaxID=1076926 RepID=UPI0014782969|nr:hypothetical protein [Rhizobium laguerreae]NNH83563.1 hypothetical protein [Rhizobium laguerreae]
MIKFLSVSLVVGFAILPSTAWSACSDNAMTAANDAIAAVARAENTTIPAATSKDVTAEIADSVCSSSVGSDQGQVSEISKTVSKLYFESAVKLGKSTEVPALVDSAIDNTNGLGMDDFRRFGALTVTCATENSVVEVGESELSCSSRALIADGETMVKVLDDKTDVCEARFTMGERQEFSCECQAAVGTPEIPVNMQCTRR